MPDIKIKKCDTMGCGTAAEWRMLYTDRETREMVVEHVCTEDARDYMRRPSIDFVAIFPFPTKLTPSTRSYHAIGDRVELVMPHTGACLSMQVAGKRMRVELLENYMAQLYTLDGTHYSGPVTWGEAGIYIDCVNGDLPYTITA